MPPTADPAASMHSAVRAKYATAAAATPAPADYAIVPALVVPTEMTAVALFASLSRSPVGAQSVATTNAAAMVCYTVLADSTTRAIGVVTATVHIHRRDATCWLPPLRVPLRHGVTPVSGAAFATLPAEAAMGTNLRADAGQASRAPGAVLTERGAAALATLPLDALVLAHLRTAAVATRAATPAVRAKRRPRWRDAGAVPRSRLWRRRPMMHAKSQSAHPLTATATNQTHTQRHRQASMTR